MTDKALIVLLSNPALDFVRDVRKKLDSDPGFVETHEKELRKKVSTLLVDSGLLWDQPVLERESIPLLKEAIMHLRLIEK